MCSINAWLGPFSIEATEAVALDIILKFLVYLAKNILLKRYILKKTNLDFFLIFPRKGYLSGWGLYVWSKYSYSCSLKQFIERSVQVIIPYNKSGIDNTY